jgi:Tol biopolymer transport system component
VAGSSRGYYDKTWNTFTDFLLFYVRDVMGAEWWREQAATSAGVLHPMLTWYDHISQHQPNAARD